MDRACGKYNTEKKKKNKTTHKKIKRRRKDPPIKENSSLCLKATETSPRFRLLPRKL